jgi:hypothetical protein
MSQTAEKLRKILEELDPSKLEELSEQKILEMRKELNPYGRIISGSNQYLVFSYTDLREKYLKKLLTTTLIGFLNRANAEWKVPDGIQVVHPYDYVRDTSLLDDPETYKDPKAKKEAAENIEFMKERITVQKFLESVFQFNPDDHVRSAHRPSPEDPERKPVTTPAAKLAIKHLRKKDKSFNERMEKKEALDELKKSTAEEPNTEKPEPEPVAQTDVERYTTEMIPPADTFGKFTRYLEANYDKLREVTNDLYCEKPDLDRAICPHAMLDSRKEADNYIDKHKDELITEVIPAMTGKWNFFAPFAKVRDSTRYFNEKTMVLEEIMGQIESDSKLGEDLMKKRIAKKKKENIAEAGEDDEGFKKWRKTNNTLKEMNAWEKEEETVEQDECPDDGIEVGVFSFSKGGKEMETTKFYTQAEAPKMPTNDSASSSTEKEK